MRKLPTILALLALTALPIFGHHAAPVFDSAKMQTVDGTVTKLEWVNPHVVVYFDQKDAATGTVQAWRFEMPNPATLQSQGLLREMFKVDTKISVTGVPVKPRTHALWPYEVKLPDGVRWAAAVDKR